MAKEKKETKKSEEESLRDIIVSLNNRLDKVEAAIEWFRGKGYGC